MKTKQNENVYHKLNGDKIKIKMTNKKKKVNITVWPNREPSKLCWDQSAEDLDPSSMKLKDEAVEYAVVPEGLKNNDDKSYKEQVDS